MTREITLRGDNVPEDLRDTFEQGIGANPTDKSLLDMRRSLRDHPGLAKKVLNLGANVREELIKNLIPHAGAAAILEAEIYDLGVNLGYKESPPMEQLLIEQIMVTWLRLQHLEYRMNDFMQGGVSMRESEFWERRLTQAQARHIKAIETLARVRKITRATMQINIAEAGSQQMNIAGDLKR